MVAACYRCVGSVKYGMVCHEVGSCVASERGFRMTKADKETMRQLRAECIRRKQILPDPGDVVEEAIAREAQNDRRAA